MAGMTKAAKSLLPSILIVLSAAAIERSIYGFLLTSLILLVLFAIGSSLTRKILGGQISNKLGRRVVIGASFLAYTAIIFWISYSRYLGDGELYIGMTPLVSEGGVTMIGYFYSAFSGFILCLATAMSTSGEKRHV